MIAGGCTDVWIYIVFCNCVLNCVLIVIVLCCGVLLGLVVLVCLGVVCVDLTCWVLMFVGFTELVI